MKHWLWFASTLGLAWSSIYGVTALLEHLSGWDSPWLVVPAGAIVFVLGFPAIVMER